MNMQAEMRFVNNRESWQFRESLDRRTTLSIYHSKIEQKAILSFMNKLYAIGRQNKEKKL